MMKTVNPELLTKKDFYRLLSHNYEFYAHTCLRIRDGRNTGRIIPFDFNRVQKRLWLWLKEDLVAGVPIRWKILKSRQFGGSSFLTGALYWLCTTNAAKMGLVVGHDIQTSVNLLSMAQLFYRTKPDWLHLECKINNRRELYFTSDKQVSEGLESKLRVDTADNRNLAASATFDYALFTEIARYEALGVDMESMMVAFNQTVPYRAGTAIFWETTAQGHDYFYRKWKDPKHAYRKVFISYVPIDEYRLPLEPGESLKLSNVEDSRYGDETREERLIRQEITVWFPEYSEPTEENFQAIHRLIQEKLKWRRHAIDTLCEGSKEKFRQEYPITEDDAFLLSGHTAFDNLVLSDMRSAVRSHNDTDLIEVKHARFDPGCYDPDNPHWWKYAFHRSPFGELKIFEDYDERYRYVIGGDPTQGNDSSADPAAAQVLRLPDLVQVASWTKVLEPDLFADLLFALGMCYGRALIVPEANGPGNTTVLRLSRTHHYSPLYRRQIWDTMAKRYVQKYGWWTGGSGSPAKHLMIAETAAAIRNGVTVVRDYQTIDEMMTYRKLEGGSFGGEKGKPDNLVTSYAFALMGAKEISNYQLPDSKQTRFGTWDWWEKQLDTARLSNVVSRYGKVGRIG